MSENEYVVSVEELCARKTVKRLVGRSDHEQTPGPVAISESQKNVTAVNDKGETASDIQDFRKSVDSLKEKSITSTTNNHKPKPKIQKVPMVLRSHKNFERYYEPRVVSIGPIHHQKAGLILEEYKLKFLAKFEEDSGKKIEVLYQSINDQILELRKLFDREVIKNYDDVTLSRMLFLDGCFILEFIVYFSDVIKGRKLENFDLKDDQTVYVQQDFLLLENQIPFLVLKLLMDSSLDKFKSKLISSIEEFICQNVMAPKDRNQYVVAHFSLEKEPDPTHLLELLQKAATFSPQSRDQNAARRQTTQQSFRNVQELRAAGINLKPSKNCSLTDIEFSSISFAGWLKLPPLIVDDSTGPKFFNLTAYEMCPDNFRTNYEVTSFVTFMDSLIDQSSDVKELRKKKIIHNLLGSDDDVALLFNEIAIDLVPNPKMYKDVKDRIQEHYDWRWTTWMAEAYSNHFSSPWSILAFVGALVALGLTGIQTWYTIHPAADS
ncbi:hypothetical protein PanWU01x14_292710 [Parasponia andersonii]|uniref:Uncharacterized protein n=1 Tax=Parasponia andersonii TaxID=3476 RepID=A0A2P5AWS4_PARAD|nr:hypothetical protein PanWU01x14_292710 [Parasponia andersonii]